MVDSEDKISDEAGLAVGTSGSNLKASSSSQTQSQGQAGSGVVSVSEVSKSNSKKRKFIAKIQNLKNVKAKKSLENAAESKRRLAGNSNNELAAEKESSDKSTTSKD